MENKLFFENLEQHRGLIINAKIRGVKSLIEHNQNTYKPEMREYCGYSQAEYNSRLESELEKLIYDLKHKTPLYLMEITKSEALNYLRGEAHDMRRTARDFPANPWIVMRSLRKAVKIAQLMIKLEPRLEIYSLHWICNSTPIHLA